MSSKKGFLPDRKSARRVAQSLVQPVRLTCEGCAWLQLKPRSQCKGEASPHYRQVRDTHMDRCNVFMVPGAVYKYEEEKPPLSRFGVAGEVKRLKRRMVK